MGSVARVPQKAPRPAADRVGVAHHIDEASVARESTSPRAADEQQRGVGITGNARTEGHEDERRMSCDETLARLNGQGGDGVHAWRPARPSSPP